MTQPTLSIAHWVASLSHKISSPAAFAALVESQLERARADGADILLAPEHISEYWMSFAPKDLPLTQETEWVADRAAEILPLLQAAVTKTGVALVAGSFSFRDAQSGKCRNRSYMLFPDREAVYHDKCVLTPSEKDCNGWFFETGSRLNVFDWRGLRLSLVICLDVEMPHLAHLIAQEDIDLLLVPSMTSQPAGYYRVFSCARARAVELFAAVAVVGCTGGATGADGKPRETYNGGAAVYIPSEVAFGHTGIFSDLPVHAAAPDAGQWLLSKNIPLGHIRDIRRGKAGKPEAWPGAWDASHITVTRDCEKTRKIC